MPDPLVQEQPEIQALARQVTATISLATAAIVETTEHVEWATAVLAELARHRKRAEDLRLRFTRPLNESLKAINGVFKEMDGPLAEADRTLRQKVLVYRAAEQARAAAEQIRLRAEAAAREAEARALIQSTAPQAEVTAAIDAADAAHDAVVLAPPPPAPTVKTAMGTTTARRVTDFEVTDLAQVPILYLQLNAEAVRAAIRRGVRDIPGVRIFEREILAVRMS